MTIQLELDRELQSRLLQEAAKHGVAPEQYITEAVQDRLGRQQSDAPHLDAAESQLLGEINEGLSQSEWDRYEALITKRQANALSSHELEELTAISDRIEQLNARRMDRLAQLARLRGTTLPKLLDQLGIVAPPVI